MPLHHHEHVATTVFGGDIPWLFGVSAFAANLQTAALSQSVEGEALVGAEALALGRLDRTGRFIDETAEKLSKRTFADEADAGAVGFVEDRQPGASRSLAHRAFFQLSKWHERAGQVLGSDGV